MNLKRQLLIVSLLTLVLPWAGCQFIAETESALRSSQQQMLSGTATAIADSLSQYRILFPQPVDAVNEQLYAHSLATAPSIDGYFDDWALTTDSLRQLRGTDGPIRFALGIHGASLYLYADIPDDSIVYSAPGTIALENSSHYSDRLTLISVGPDKTNRFVFGAEAPGPIVAAYVRDSFGFAPDTRMPAYWRDYPGGYRIEARVPLSRLGSDLGVVVSNTSDPLIRPINSLSYGTGDPGRLASISKQLQTIVTGLAQPGLRLTLTDANGWRIATAGDLAQTPAAKGAASAWMRVAYEALIESGEDGERAAPDASGREQQPYVNRALTGDATSGWFRDFEDGRAIVAVAQPVIADSEVIGAVIVQQGTEAILSLTNERLTNLMYTTVGVTLLVAITLLGYATWLSRRIRRLSQAAEQAVDTEDLRRSLPSALDGDEVGDLSRSFGHVLGQLGEYNEYLRTLASKLSHELRTPLTIVSSSLDNLEHEPLSDAASEYTARAKDGAARLRRILTAMSEASRVEELMRNAEFSNFDLAAVIASATAAYRDIYPLRQFEILGDDNDVTTHGSPELLIQMLDKIVNNAVDFSADGDTISVRVQDDSTQAKLAIHNPGPELPEKMRGRLFDSMVSVRQGDDAEHLGLGLYVSRLIAEGHGGAIAADNVNDGVEITVTLPRSEAALVERGT
ncbi:MAG: ATP-binding protein [Pseudomonadota bacterium]